MDENKTAAHDEISGGPRWNLFRIEKDERADINIPIKYKQELSITKQLANALALMMIMA